jgi:hypothetical protein
VPGLIIRKAEQQRFFHQPDPDQPWKEIPLNSLQRVQDNQHSSDSSTRQQIAEQQATIQSQHAEIQSLSASMTKTVVESDKARKLNKCVSQALEKEKQRSSNLQQNNDEMARAKEQVDEQIKTLNVQKLAMEMELETLKACVSEQSASQEQMTILNTEKTESGSAPRTARDTMESTSTAQARAIALCPALEESRNGRLDQMLQQQDLPSQPDWANVQHIRVLFLLVLRMRTEIAEQLDKHEVDGGVLLELINSDGLSTIGATSKLEQAKIKSCIKQWKRLSLKREFGEAGARSTAKRPKTEAHVKKETSCPSSYDLT